MKHLIQLWPGDWVKQMPKMNEAMGMKNRFTMDGGGKWFVCPFERNEFWKCIGCVILAVTYGKKLHSEIPKPFCRMAPTKLQKYFRGNTNLYKGMF